MQTKGIQMPRECVPGASVPCKISNVRQIPVPINPEFYKCMTLFPKFNVCVFGKVPINLMTSGVYS